MASNLVALVTGSGKKRVGFTVAQFLARKGYDIALHYNSSANEAKVNAEELQKLGVRAHAFQADLTNADAVRGLIEAVVERFDRLDVLVNCAAIWERKPLEDVRVEDVKKHFDTNALGTFLCCQHAGLHMVKQSEGGVIINVGDWAVERPYLNYAAYFPSKGAVSTITRSMAVELGTRNPQVRVNGILPGPVMLPEDLPAEEKQQAIDATLVKREGSPDHIAMAVWALVENDFITGVLLPVDGGRTIYAPE